MAATRLKYYYNKCVCYYYHDLIHKIVCNINSSLVLYGNTKFYSH